MSERQMLYRSATDWADLEIRAEGDEGIVSGIAVPWNRPTRIDDQLTEAFERGAFDAQISRPHGVFLAREHIPLGGSPIGRLSVMRNDAAGLFVEGKVSRTQVGEETLTLLRDGVLDRLSIGFLEGQNRRDREGVVWRKTATLREVAIVLRPAYVDAVVTGVRGACDRCGRPFAAEEREDHERGDAAELALIANRPALPLPPRPRHR